MTSARPLRKILCANRGEIAIRVFRAATELGLRTVAIYSHEDRLHLHRYKADEAYLVGRGKSPVGAYLAIEDIIRIASEVGVDAIHPGYGFLAERSAFAQACSDAGIAFVGPPPKVIEAFGDKVAARALAQKTGVPVVPGTEGPVATVDEARAFAKEAGFPLIIKAAMGGGGRGMRVVRSPEELEAAFEHAVSEAESAFGDGTVFIERYVDRPRHIEVQILADAAGEVIHLYERDCSVQRRHQKVVEVAPAVALSDELRAQLLDDAVKLAKGAGYIGAGTVEFLVGADGEHYFIEVNPRIQVEHTVTEQVTGVDIVQTQLLIAGGATFADLGLEQGRIATHGHAIQCRVTTEDPTRGFVPDTGRLSAFRAGEGMGIRLDGGSGYAGATIGPHYDSLLVKVTGHASTFADASRKVQRSLAEFRVRGIKTNLPFLRNVLAHPTFASGTADTTFVDQCKELFHFPPRRNRGQKLLRYLGELAVNGPMTPWSVQQLPSRVEPTPPVTDGEQKGWRDLLRAEGPAAFAKQVRAHEPLLITDTTWRDAHQSLLATRVRTRDLAAIAPATSRLLSGAFSLEMWGGATFDVALRFLKECPWERLETLREAVPNIPLQMLLRGANAVGYTNYPDNVVERFVREASARGIDVFRIFDCLNYVENLKFSIDVVGAAGGVIEACVCYTGDVADPARTKYSLQYYVDLAGELVEAGTHVLAIKDMAGLLKPVAARQLVSALRDAYPEVPVHVHTHDTAAGGVAAMLAAADAGADVVDLALPALAGLTSQPSMGAVAVALRGTPRETAITADAIQTLDDYWSAARSMYAPFESGLKSGSVDVYEHEMPGGQYTNLQFQAQQLGLAARWPAIKRAYGAANRLLGDIIKVTPSSKVVGDLAQFMVQNDLTEDDVREQAATLSFPQSVTEFFRGGMGIPKGGFPEPLRTQILRGAPPIEGRPGASMAPFDFESLAEELGSAYGDDVRDVDVVTAALYPQVYRDYAEFRASYGKVEVIPTPAFLAPPVVGEELSVEIEPGKTLIVKLTAVGELDHGGERQVFFELNGQPRSIRVADGAAASDVVRRELASDLPGSVGAPMPGAVIDVKVAPGDTVAAGEPLVVLSAMKMETPVAAPVAGKVARVVVGVGDTVGVGDLLVELAD